ncbi:MAG: thioredoxin-disulfide reductase [bacterium]
MPEKIYDLAIVGGGPSGLTAAIYARRRELDTVIIAGAVGGQMSLNNEIENYPGFEMTSGYELAEKMKHQADKFDAQRIEDEITSISPIDGGFILKSNNHEYQAKSVILSFGLHHREVGVPGEHEFTGRGVSYCAICDGPFFKNKTVTVIGGGNSALEAANYLSEICAKVYIINKYPQFNGTPFVIKKVSELSNVQAFQNYLTKEIKGDTKVTSIIINDANDASKTTEITTDGVFIEIGYQPKTDWLKGIVDLNPGGEIIINEKNETSVPGIFASGDCSNVPFKQIIIAAGEGAKAALQAYKYLSNK